MTFKQIEREALNLPLSERSRLAEKLVISIEKEQPEPEISPELAAELERIAARMTAHPETVVPHDVAMRRLWKAVGK
jgi:putative addiction module component (TIGR02574 family)